MVRVTNAVASRRRRKKILKQTKGFWGDRKGHIRQSKNAVMKAMAYNYEHRKAKKGDFRRLWIMRLSVAAKINGLSYSRFMNGLKLIGSELNRKILSELAIHDPQSFQGLAVQVKDALQKV